MFPFNINQSCDQHFVWGSLTFRKCGKWKTKRTIAGGGQETKRTTFGHQTRPCQPVLIDHTRTNRPLYYSDNMIIDSGQMQWTIFSISPTTPTSLIVIHDDQKCFQS